MQGMVRDTFILPDMTEGFPEEVTLELGFEVQLGIQEAENEQKGFLGSVNSKKTKVLGKKQGTQGGPIITSRRSCF